MDLSSITEEKEAVEDELEDRETVVRLSSSGLAKKICDGFNVPQEKKGRIVFGLENITREIESRKNGVISDAGIGDDQLVQIEESLRWRYVAAVDEFMRSQDGVGDEWPGLVEFRLGLTAQGEKKCSDSSSASSLT